MNNQEELNKLVGVHLGKAGDGSAVKPYVTPDEVDPSLLVAVPRHLNRTGYGIQEEELPFVGIDAWNSYEFSTLQKNGFPISGWLKFTYSSSTPNIVESKSVKLYLNSYNMARLIESKEELWKIEEQVERDIAKAVGGEVGVYIAIGDVDTVKPMKGDFMSLENYCNVDKMSFDRYNESSDILEVVPSIGRYERWRSHSLRSNCRVTNQPDWGDVYIHIKGEKAVTPESLLQYIVSMRKENHFHEEIAECIYKRLWDLLEPEELLVTCLYTRRGGIDINPTRASNYPLLNEAPIIDAYNFCEKTARQ
ncbi:7-cyano-7-deazaguanine reductase [uncultured Caudovirales phage]|uniref:7-cyano-7-deazaguanine reductase n=1 Tax=uncultured Caudovirales phage TaxID=2100421 RepID=A0A6J7WZ13_9CAUD|nr:7-cyano-7-deazaguanine reductase [uncultured Caudovirales phage]